ncbi:MAG: polysaccharide deacetylase family protein [Pseudomonadota bacterium]
MSTTVPRYLASIHDVMPTTLNETHEIFHRLQDAGLAPVTLLVVPGKGWDAESLKSLRRLVGAGAELAGHGWSHQIRQIRGLKHRLHSALISRNAAEHLALSRDEAIDLMQRCYAWFDQHHLPSPGLYVPPAWAMGDVLRHQLDDLPFDQFETLAGVYDSRSQRFMRLPMLGYEADTTFRALGVRTWNSLNLTWATLTDRPIRLGIHPEDFSLKLAHDLERLLAQPGECLRYDHMMI